MTLFDLYNSLPMDRFLEHIKQIKFKRLYATTSRDNLKKPFPERNEYKLIDCLENVLNLSNCILKTHTDFSFRKSYIYLDIYPVDQDYMKVCSIKLNLKKSLNRNIPALEKSVNILHGGYNENKVFIYREHQ